MEGWIKLYRKIKENPLWLEPRRFTRLEAWLDLLLRANHRGQDVFLGNDTYPLTAGQFITSQLKLAEAWGWHRDSVRNFLSYLEREKSISYMASNRNTIITILNWDSYQNSHSSDSATPSTSNGHEIQHQKGTDNNDNNDNNEKNGKNIKNLSKNFEKRKQLNFGYVRRLLKRFNQDKYHVKQHLIGEGYTEFLVENAYNAIKTYDSKKKAS